MQSTDPIMPPIQESTSATARRLRRRLRDLYPHTTFRVVVRRGADGADLVVTWTGGPTTPEVLVHVRPFARRTALGEEVEPTMWSSPEGLVSLVYPGAERVRLQHTPTLDT